MVGTITTGARPPQDSQKPVISSAVAFFEWIRHRVGAGLAIGLGAAQGLVHAPAGDQRLDAGDELKVVVRSGCLCPP